MRHRDQLTLMQQIRTTTWEFTLAALWHFAPWLGIALGIVIVWMIIGD
jgi:hypothetical protein